MPGVSLQLALALEPLTIADHMRDSPILIFGVLLLCIATAFLALWRSAPDYRVFRSAGLYLGVISIEQFWRYFVGTASEWVIAIWGNIFLVIAAAEALQIKNRRWTWLVWPIFVIDVLAVVELNLDSERALFLASGSLVVAQAAIAIFIVGGFRSKESSLRLIAAGFTLVFFFRLTIFPQFRAMTGIPEFIHIRGWRWYFPTISIVLIGMLTLAVYVRALIHDRREKLRLAGEFEAARAVQQILIPDETPTLAGFQVESIYKPAGEVGGDFFQIVPNRDSSTLVVLGDVSGKGLKAAMTVSLIVGMVRAMSNRSLRPADLLAELNHRLLGRLQGGFVTCIALVLNESGGCVLSSAGHPAPFLRHREIDLPGSLPLGLDASPVFPEIAIQLEIGDRLVLYTDGLVEARSHAGELFGFERLGALLASSAGVSQAAESAQQFGQEDDITILAFTRLASGALVHHTSAKTIPRES